MVVLPDAERIAVSYLLSRSEVTDLVGTRVFTKFPKRESDRVWPLIRVTRVGGGPTGAPIFMDRAILQFEAFGGTNSEARLIASTITGVLDEITGYNAHGGYSTGSTPGTVRSLPDDSFKPAKPRYTLDAFVFLRPTS